MHHGFVCELYNGKLRLDLVHPYPLDDPVEDAKAQLFLEGLAHVLESIDTDQPVEMVVLFCRQSRRRVEHLFKTIFNNDDMKNYKLALDVLEGKHIWLEQDLPHLAKSSNTWNLDINLNLKAPS